MIRRNILRGAAAAALLAAAGCATPPAEPTIVDIASQDARFSTLVTAVQAAGLVETLSGPGPFTVFAPTNAAFDALPKGTLEILLTPGNEDQLRSILTYHVVPGATTSDQLVGQSLAVETVNGATVAIDGTMGGVMVNQANVIQADVTASNGVIHAIDSVLLP